MASGMYGYGLYMIDKPLTGPCKLSAGAVCCQGRNCCGTKQHRQSALYDGDTPCKCHKIAFLRESGLHSDDVAYFTMRTGIVRRPYCVCVDRSTQAVVVVVRGTFALEDAVADLTLSPSPLDGYGERFEFDGTGEFAHSGMLASAEWVYNDIVEQGILEELLLDDNPDYKLYVTGHRYVLLVLHRLFDNEWNEELRFDPLKSTRTLIYSLFISRYLAWGRESPRCCR